ncbi:MAG: 2-hydroxyacyl-CoA dehydratase family protein [bacterium]|nr:2-hydroxyacyl-CoA dehydratase family protein [bacterium]
MTPNPKQQAAAFKHAAMEAMSVLDRICNEFPDNPKAMGRFYRFFEQRHQGQADWGPAGTRIGTACVQVPEELIYAVGATPERLCNGAYTFDQIGSEFLPIKSCSLVKATHGVLAMQNRPDRLPLVVLPTTCDQKKKSGVLLEDMGYHTWVMEMPPYKDTPEAVEYWRASVAKLAGELERTTGRKITKKGLRDALAKTQAAKAQYRRFHQLRKLDPAVIWGKDAFLVTNSYFFAPIEDWTDALSQLNDELEKRRDTGTSLGGKKAPRVLFTGSPPIFPNLKVPLMIEELGGLLVTDEVCSSTRLLYDAPAPVEEGKYEWVESIADRYLKPCTCPCYAPNEDRKRKLARLVEDFAVDGVIYQSLSGCQLYEFEQKPVERFLAERGIPMLYLESDYSPEDQGQLSTRIEAFLESLKTKKRKRKL